VSHLREDFETLGKAVPATSLFLSYMESLFYVSRGKTGEGGTGKTDYRNLRRVGWIVHMDLFDRRGQKRKHQLQGGWIVSPGDCRLCCFDEKIFIPGLVAFAHNLSIKHGQFRACKGRSSISQ
jgi:hypothetical protein